MTDLKALIERLWELDGPDREMDCLIHVIDLHRTSPAGDPGRFHVVGPPTYDPKRFFYCPNSKMDWIGYDLLNVSPAYTASTDAAEGLVKRVLPGWCYRMGTCCVSDDAWVAPDHNCPVHGKRLREEYGEPVFNSVFDAGVDIDRRPPGSIAIALCIAILTALVAVEDKKAEAK